MLPYSILNKRSSLIGFGVLFLQAQDVTALFEYVQDKTGVKSIDEMITVFTKAESRNFGLIKHINTLEKEVEAAYVAHASMKTQLEQLNNQQLVDKQHGQEKQVLGARRRALERAQEACENEETRFYNTAVTMQQLKRLIWKLYTKLDCSDTDSNQLDGAMDAEAEETGGGHLVPVLLGSVEQRITHVRKLYLKHFKKARVDSQEQNTEPQRNGQSRVAIHPPEMWVMDEQFGKEDRDVQRPLVREELISSFLSRNELQVKHQARQVLAFTDVKLETEETEERAQLGVDRMILVASMSSNTCSSNKHSSSS